MLATYARRRPMRAILLALIVVLLVDFGADDGCSCNDFAQRSVASAIGGR